MERQVRRGSDGGASRPSARRARALARGLYARRSSGPTGAVRAREDRVENRGPELGPPLQGARRPDPDVARGERVLRAVISTGNRERSFRRVLARRERPALPRVEHTEGPRADTGAG